MDQDLSVIDAVIDANLLLAVIDAKIDIFAFFWHR
jgi:rRNA-processing protein FCF1